MLHMSSRNTDRSSIYTDNGRIGFVYLLTNKHMPGLVKAGACRKHPLLRATELGANTGVPGAFTIAYFRDFADCFKAESLVHERFDPVRVNASREFFQAPLSEIIAFVNSLPTSAAYEEGLVSQGVIGGEYQGEQVATPMAELFSTFDQDGPPELSAEEQARCRALEASLQ